MELGLVLTGLALLFGLALGWVLYRAQHNRLEALAQRIVGLAQASFDAICIEDAQGRVVFWSPGAAAQFGFSADEMRGQPANRLIPPELRQQEAALLEAAGPQTRTLETLRLTKAGKLLSVSIGYSILRDRQGRRTGLCRVMRASPKPQVADELIRAMSFNDSLTGLPNWRLLRDRLWRAQLASGRQRSCFAVLYVDLDNFRLVNDRLGHDAGDQLLIEVSARLMAAVRQNDTVARLGGDEFVVLLEDLGGDAIHARNHANTVADKMLDLLEQRDFVLGHSRVGCTASIGIEIVQGGNGQVDQVIKAADASMARVKAGRRMVASGDFAKKI